MTKPQPKDTQGDKGQYENNVQLVQWISSVCKSANYRCVETCLVQYISSEIKLRKSHCTGCNPKPYTGTYYIIRANKGNRNIDENPDRSKSVINYGTNTTININGKKLKEYFDVVNIDY